VYKNICIKILKEFSEDQFRSFKRFAGKSLGSSNLRLQKLIKELDKEFPEFAGKRLQRDVLFIKIFKEDKKVEVQKLRHVMADLKKIIEQFLLLDEVNENEFRKQYLLGRAYRKLGLHHLQQTCLSKSLDILEKDSRRDSRFFFKKYQINEDLFRNNDEIRNTDRTELIKTILINLDKLYFIEKLKYACEFINSQKFRNIDFDINLFNDVLRHVELKQLEEVPVLHTYYAAFKTLIEPKNESHFHKLKDLLHSNSNLFNKYEINEIYIYARNYCVRQINQQNEIYIEELFNLNLYLLENHQLFAGTYLTKNDYRNMITLGSWLKKFNWVENFLEDYKDKLNPIERENAYFFNKASFEFERKNFEEVIVLLNQYQYSETEYQFKAKVLLAKSYYELNQYSVLINLLDSFKVLLHRNKKLPKLKLNAYKAFCTILPKVANLKYNSKMNFTKAEEYMKKYSMISDKNWLQQKIDEFKIDK